MSWKGVPAAARFSHKYDDSQHMLDRRMSLKGVAVAARAAAESAEHAAAAARAAALLASEKLDRNMEGSSSDSESDNEASVLHERFEDNHLNSGRVAPDHSSTLRMPIFDEPVEVKRFHRVHSSGNNPLSYDESREEQSVSCPIFSTESYDFDDTESLSHSTTSMERHVDDQASRQRLDRSISSSNNRNQHNNTGSFATADTYEWDDAGNKRADEAAAQSRPPKRPPPQLPGAQPPTLTKSTSFVHPKLPDYDELTAHFQALKAMNSKK